MAPKISGVSTYLDPALCANNHDEMCRTEKTLLMCKGCKMVQYCSKGCQVADWPRHKKDCRSSFMKRTWKPRWVTENRQSTFMNGDAPTLPLFGTSGYLWGNTPALDVLRVGHNEGVPYASSHDFNILFAASGDLRNVIKTVSEMPEGYDGECTVVVNDLDFYVAARSIIMLTIALECEADVATPMILHLWYSALIPSTMMEAVESFIAPLFEEVCDEIKDELEDTSYAKTFTKGTGQVRVELPTNGWTHLTKLCRRPRDLTAETAQQNRRSTVLAPEQADYLDRAMLLMPANVQVGEMHFRQSGVLLPHGCSTREFDTPNP